MSNVMAYMMTGGDTPTRGRRKTVDNTNISMRISKELDNKFFQAALMVSQAEGENVTKQEIMRRYMEKQLANMTPEQLAEMVKNG